MKNCSILSRILVLLIIIGMFSTVASAECAVEEGTEQVIVSSEAIAVPSALPETPVEPNAPILVFNLSQNDYVGSFTGVTVGWETARAFRPNSDGILYIEIETDDKCLLTLHDRTDGSTSTYELPADTTKNIKWINLDVDHVYFFSFKSNYSDYFAHPVSGEFTISHNSLL